MNRENNRIYFCAKFSTSFSKCIIQCRWYLRILFNVATAFSTPVVLLSWLLATTIDSRVQCTFDAINQVGIIAGRTILDIDDRLRLLVDLLCECSLRHLGGHAGILDRLSTSVRHGLILDFFVFINSKVVVGHSLCMVVSLSGSCATTVSSCSSITSLGPYSAGHKHLSLLTTIGSWLALSRFLLRSSLLHGLLNLFPVSVHFSTFIIVFITLYLILKQKK